MKKIIIAIIAIATMMTMVSCNREPKSETTGDNTLVLSSGVEVTFGEVVLGEMIPAGTIKIETIETETIETETIEEETIIEESTSYVSDEYLAELEYNSQTNRW